MKNQKAVTYRKRLINTRIVYYLIVLQTFARDRPFPNVILYQHHSPDTHQQRV